MKTGSTLNFAKESQAFAKALQTEHAVLGDLLADIDVSIAAKGFAASDLSLDLVNQAREAHKAVKFQRARTEAARGRRA